MYDEAFYRAEYNPHSAALFLQLADEMDKLVKQNGWHLERKFNKYYCGFKSGFFNAFGLRWETSKTIYFFFKLSEAETKETGVKNVEYDPNGKEAYVYVEPSKTRVQDLLPLFRAAYGKLTGK